MCVLCVYSMEDVERAKFRINEALGYNKSYETKPDEFQEIDWGNVEAEYEAAQKEKWAKFPPLKKDFYEEHPNVATMSQVSENFARIVYYIRD